MMQHKRLIALGLWASAALMTAPASAQPVPFGLFGDTPYSAWERDNLPALITAMDQEELAFVVHDGDIKNGASECSDAVFNDILRLFQASKTPLIYVPGDNEWTDCHRNNNGSYDPMERLNKLRSLFFTGDSALGQRKLLLQRQSQAGAPAFASYRENVRWEAGGALFVGLNLPGSDNNFYGTQHKDKHKDKDDPSPEFVARSAANRAWLAQAFAQARTHKLAGIMVVIQANPEFESINKGKRQPGYDAFVTQLREETQAFAGQVVLVHGDSHSHQINQPMRDPVSRDVVPNFTRVETLGFPFFGWVKATVDVRDPKVFQFAPRPWPKSVGN
jgi:hypothetical protein